MPKMVKYNSDRKKYETSNEKEKEEEIKIEIYQDSVERLLQRKAFSPNNSILIPLTERTTDLKSKSYRRAMALQHGGISNRSHLLDSSRPKPAN